MNTFNRWLLTLVLVLVGVAALSSLASRSTGQQVQLPASPAATDPCNAANKIVTPINISTATTTQLVALSAGKAIYVCSAVLDIAGSTTTAGSAVFEYGTGSSCATGTNTLTGPMAGSTTTGTPTIIQVQGYTTELGTATGNALCILSAGTTVGITGYVTVVQQ